MECELQTVVEKAGDAVGIVSHNVEDAVEKCATAPAEAGPVPPATPL